jgi:hypothetical protein
MPAIKNFTAFPLLEICKEVNTSPHKEIRPSSEKKTAQQTSLMEFVTFARHRMTGDGRETGYVQCRRNDQQQSEVT